MSGNDRGTPAPLRYETNGFVGVGLYRVSVLWLPW
jgi:hypothetical protein